MILALHFLHNVFNYFEIIIHGLININKPKLGIYHINKFYETAVILEFIALSDVLDVVAPYNVVPIPNNWFTRKFMGTNAGKSVPRKMINTGTRIFLEDIP